MRYLRWAAARGGTSIPFGENQLALGSIGISPLSTAPPTALQRRTVRASTTSYSGFTLAMDSSPSFGSHHTNSPKHCSLLAQEALLGPRPLQTCFRFASTPCGFKLASMMHSPVHSSIGTPSCSQQRICCQMALPHRTLTVRRHTVAGLFIPLAGCFSPFPHGTGSLSVAVCI